MQRSTWPSRKLTAGLVEALRCPGGKEQAFLRDTKAPGLRVRVTAAGAKAYVFESKVNGGKTLRRTIGSPAAWTIDAARIEARRLRVLVDQNADPRELDRRAAEEAARRSREQETAAAAVEAEERANAMTVREAWDRLRRRAAPALGRA